MSQENVEVFKRGVDAWNREDFDAWIDHLDPDIEWSARMEVYLGHAGARQLWQSFKHMRLTVRFEDVRDLGDNVLALGEMTAKGQRTGLDLKSELGQLATFRDAKVIRFRDFGSHAEAVAAAGLSE
jgi:ketosteroid isomerase-like protein